MIFVVGRSPERDQIAADLKTALPLLAVEAGAPYPITLPTTAEWNDLLVVLFGGLDLYDVPSLVAAWRNVHPTGHTILPVALDPAGAPVPPSPIEHIKALVWDASAAGPAGRLVARIAAMVGGRPDRRPVTVFVSYRMADGRATAVTLKSALEAAGYAVLIDEADRRTTLTEGEPVQPQIHGWVRDQADLMILLDTPKAPESRWVADEVRMAVGALVPVLPVVCRAAGDRDRGPRFPALRELRRYADLPSWREDGVFDPGAIARVIEEVDAFVLDVLRRRQQLPFVARATFADWNFEWAVRPEVRHGLYDARRERRRSVDHHLVHCSLLGQFERGSAIEVLRLRTPDHQRAFYLFDGTPVPSSHLDEAIAGLGGTGADALVALHINELRGWLDEEVKK